MLKDIASTSGYHLPLMTLSRMGMVPVPINAKTKPPAAVSNYSAGASETAVLAALLSGSADVGALSNLDWIDDTLNPPSIRQQLKIIHYTPPVLRSLALMRRGISNSVRDALVKALTTAHMTEAGRSALKSYKVRRFDLIDAEALVMLDESRRMSEQVLH